MSNPTPVVRAVEPPTPVNLDAAWTALRYWWKVAAPIGLVIAMGVVFAVVRFFPPQYTAVAWLTVRDRPDFVIETSQREDPIKFVENQRQLMHSAFVLEPVANDPAVDDIPELAEHTDRVEALQRQLKISAIGRSDYFTLQFTGVDPHKTADLVNRVAKSYVTAQSKSQAARNRDLIEGLSKEQRGQQQEVEKLRKTVEQLNASVTDQEGSSPSPMARREPRSAVSQLQREIVAAEVEQAVLKAQLDSERQSQALDVPAPSEAEIERSLQKNERIRALSNKISDDRRKLREHEANSVNLASNRLYENLRVQVAASEKELEQWKQEERKLVAAELQQIERAKRKDEITDLENRLSSSRFTAALLRDRLQEERAGKSDSQGDALRLEFAKSDYEQAVDVHGAISARIRNLQMEGHSPTRVEIFRRAEAPKKPDSFPFSKVGVLAAAAFLFPFGIAIGWEQLRRRISSRGQIEEAGQIAVIGEIATMPRQILRPAARHRPSRELQLFDESINSLRTHLAMMESLGGRGTIAITSAVSGEGKSSLAWQLAHSIADATGEAVLLIDGDLRSPTIHRLLKIRRGVGLGDLLQGAATLSESIQTDHEGSLHVLTAGNIAASPHRLLSSPRFDGLLDDLRATYRHIVIDTPPILSASEALLLARAADLVLVCVRRDYSRCHQTTEAVARLRTTSTNVGAVLTDVPVRTYVSTYGEYYSDADSQNELSVSS